jgi:hypothetical protein
MRPELAKDSWSNFRRAVTEKDREVFDEIANKARKFNAGESGIGIVGTSSSIYFGMLLITVALFMQR